MLLSFAYAGFREKTFSACGNYWQRFKEHEFQSTYSTWSASKYYVFKIGEHAVLPAPAHLTCQVLSDVVHPLHGKRGARGFSRPSAQAQRRCGRWQVLYEHQFDDHMTTRRWRELRTRETPDGLCERVQVGTGARSC